MCIRDRCHRARHEEDDPGHEQDEADEEDEDRRAEAEVLRLGVLDVDRDVARLRGDAAAAGGTEGRLVGELATAVPALLHEIAMSGEKNR